MEQRRIALFLALSLTACTPSSQRLAMPTVHIVSPAGTVRGSYVVELAQTPDEWARGLMDRTSLPLGAGMLFIFPDDAIRSFWMKNTRIPLDMLFVSNNGRINSIASEVPPCTDDPCPLQTSSEDSRYVLELAGGEVIRSGTQVNDLLMLDRPAQDGTAAPR